MTTVPGLRLDTDGAIGRIVFDRPEKANAIHPDWLPAMLGFVQRAEYDPSIRCVLIRAEGKHFQAGGDLSIDRSRSLPETVGAIHDQMVAWNRMVIALHTLPKPVVVAVQGGVIGASIGLVAACDLVIAADDAFFISAQVRIGASLDGLPSYFLPRKIGLARAMEWSLLGERIPVARAASEGLVNRIVSRDELEAVSRSVCERLASGPTAAIGRTKRLLNDSLSNDVHTQAAAEMDAYSAIAASHDWNEGISAFLEKRDSQFIGR